MLFVVLATNLVAETAADAARVAAIRGICGRRFAVSFRGWLRRVKPNKPPPYLTKGSARLGVITSDYLEWLLAKHRVFYQLTY